MWRKLASAQSVRREATEIVSRLTSVTDKASIDKGLEILQIGKTLLSDFSIRGF